MTTCAERQHPDHVHQHGPNCGHAAIRHDGHVDYLHDGHLHHMHGDHVDEHIIAVSATNPVHCTPEIRCSGHEHGPNCGHEAIPHGDHLITSSTDGSITHMAIIATITGLCSWSEIDTTELSERPCHADFGLAVPLAVK